MSNADVFNQSGDTDDIVDALSFVEEKRSNHSELPQKDYSFSDSHIRSIASTKMSDTGIVNRRGTLTMGPDDATAISRQRDTVIRAQKIEYSWEQQKYTFGVLLAAFITIWILMLVFMFPKVTRPIVESVQITELGRYGNGTSGGYMRGVFSLGLYSPNFFQITLQGMRVTIYDGNAECIYDENNSNLSDNCLDGVFIRVPSVESDSDIVSLLALQTTHLNLPFAINNLSSKSVDRIEQSLKLIGSNRQLVFVWVSDSYFTDSFSINTFEHVCETVVVSNSTTLPISATLSSAKCKELKGISQWFSNL
jgi:hypothetical protein